MAQVVVVFGADGEQGSSVARALVSNSSFKVRAVVNNPNTSRAKETQQQGGVEIVQADLNNLSNLVSVLNGAYGCYVVTETDFSKPMAHEIQQGRIVADACARAHVQHVVFSTAWPVHKALGVPAQNCDAKAEIEQYMRDLDLPLSFITVPILYESLFDEYKPHRDPNSGAFLMALPIGKCTIDLMSSEDIGPVVCNVFNNRPHFLNKTVCMSAEKMTVDDIAQILRRRLQPHVFRDRQVTVDEYRNLGFPGSMDIANMFDCFARNEQRSSIDATLRLNPNLQKFELWVTRHAHEILQKIHN